MFATFSTRGRLVIPKALRIAKGIVPGTRYEVIERADGVLIKIIHPDTPAATAQTPIPVTHP